MRASSARAFLFGDWSDGADQANQMTGFWPTSQHCQRATWTPRGIYAATHPDEIEEALRLNAEE